MRRDSIFYQLFQYFPQTLFALLETPPANADCYQFTSVEIKETAFRIDGVFLPPENDSPRVVYFCEVQFQRDNHLYERLFAELFLYLYRYRPQCDDWHAVVIYPSRQTEQQTIKPYETLLQTGQVHRIYLNELPEIPKLPIGLALMKLTAAEPTTAIEIAKELAQHTPQEPPSRRQAIIELITTIMVYKFIHLSRQEIETMLGFTQAELKQTRFYQDVKEEGRQEGERLFVIKLLQRRFGPLPLSIVQEISRLSLPQIEALGEALLDFSQITDLEIWLKSDL